MFVIYRIIQKVCKQSLSAIYIFGDLSFFDIPHAVTVPV